MDDPQPIRPREGSLSAPWQLSPRTPMTAQFRNPVALLALLALMGCGSGAPSTDPAPGDGSAEVAQAADGGAGTTGGDGASGTIVPGGPGGSADSGANGGDGGNDDDAGGEATSGTASGDGAAGEDSPPTIEALEAALDEIPDELAVVVDPSLLLPTDPQDFPASKTVGGAPVEILREYHPGNGNLLRIALVRPLRPAEADATPVLHGPEWRYYETAALRGIQWFEDGVAHGPAQRWRRVSTKVHEGRFFRGERDGLWREYAKNGTLKSLSTYVRGVQVGVEEAWFPSGQRESKSHWRAGELHGSRKIWGRDGLLVLDETYVDGVLDGRWSDFHPDAGHPREWGNYESGKRVGIWQRGSKTGAVLASIGFANGVPHGKAQVWNEDGKLVEEYENVEGQKTGPSKTWFADGTPQSEGRLENGLRVGRWMYWKNDGSVNERWAGMYEDDLRTGPLDGE